MGKTAKVQRRCFVATVGPTTAQKAVIHCTYLDNDGGGGRQNASPAVRRSPTCDPIGSGKSAATEHEQVHAVQSRHGTKLTAAFVRVVEPAMDKGFRMKDKRAKVGYIMGGARHVTAWQRCISPRTLLEKWNAEDMCAGRVRGLPTHLLPMYPVIIKLHNYLFPLWILAHE